MKELTSKEVISSGKQYTLITKGTVLPDDFLDEDGYDLNRQKYIIEVGIDNQWKSEYWSDLLTVEMIGAIVIGSKAYKDVRFRKRVESDDSYDPSKSFVGVLINNTLCKT